MGFIEPVIFLCQLLVDIGETDPQVKLEVHRYGGNSKAASRQARLCLRGRGGETRLGGSPAEIGRWRRRTTAALIVITAILAVTGLVLGIAMLLDPK